MAHRYADTPVVPGTAAAGAGVFAETAEPLPGPSSAPPPSSSAVVASVVRSLVRMAVLRRSRTAHRRAAPAADPGPRRAAASTARDAAPVVSPRGPAQR